MQIVSTAHWKRLQNVCCWRQAEELPFLFCFWAHILGGRSTGAFAPPPD